MDVDYIIVGQGIAGTSIVQRLIESNKTFVVFDQFQSDQSSRIASGLWNPVVLKRMKKVWQADNLLHELHSFYQNAENIFQTRFQDSIKVWRLFASEQESNEWTTKADQPIFENILSPLPQREQSPLVKDTHGLGEVRQSGRVDTGKWLGKARDWLLARNLLIADGFDHSKLRDHQTHFSYGNLNAKHIIFCEGMKTAINNPLFSWLPFALTKGEVLHIKCPKLGLNKIINGGVFILPLGNDVYKVGATYAWNTIETNSTATARKELLEKLDKLIDAPFEIIEQKAGIRPTVKDRRPLLGTHPDNQRMHVFNGLGSRGVLMAPYLSKMMVEYLKDGKSINPEVDIKRFVKKHYSA